MLPFSAACERNKEAILGVLRQSFAQHRQVLEIGSGTGQHAVHFAAQLPHLEWQPTEREVYLADLHARVSMEGGPNLRAPLLLDVQQTPWPSAGVDAIFTANTLHIMSWEEVRALFEGVADILSRDGTLCVYGPFRYDGQHTSPSNVAFDHMLRTRDVRSGLRDIGAVTALAKSAGLTTMVDYDLPANNRLLVYTR